MIGVAAGVSEAAVELKPVAQFKIVQVKLDGEWSRMSCRSGEQLKQAPTGDKENK